METARYVRLIDKLGVEAMDDLNQWLHEELQRQGVTRDEYREVLSRLDIINQRIDGLDRRIDGLDKRMDGLTTEFQQFRMEMNSRFERVDDRFDRMNSRFERIDARFDQMYEHFNQIHERLDRVMRWNVAMIGTVGAVIAVLITIFRFVG